MGDILAILRREARAKLSGGIYHWLQVAMTYNSNRIEGSRLSEEQTRQIFETNTVGLEGSANVDDIIETRGHFRAIALVIRQAPEPVSAELMQELHRLLKTGTTYDMAGYAVGEWKRLPNEVGMSATVAPEQVEEEIAVLISRYERWVAQVVGARSGSGETGEVMPGGGAFDEDETGSDEEEHLHGILDFHVRFEQIHPFQDGNGRVGRLLALKECLRLGVTPFIIGEELKLFYYRGIREWVDEPGYLIGTAQSGQDEVRRRLVGFGHLPRTVE